MFSTCPFHGACPDVRPYVCLISTSPRRRTGASRGYSPVGCMRASPFPCKNVIVRRWESALYSTLCCCGALTNRRAVFSSLLVLRPNESGWFNPRSRVKRVIRSAHQHADTNSIANQKKTQTLLFLWLSIWKLGLLGRWGNLYRQESHLIGDF